ncbi:MAG: hypothetical protein Q9209_004714 [Squamulea sp. 1 TL-2023]
MLNTALLVFMLVVSALQVNIELHFSRPVSAGSLLAICPNIPPGQCCVAQGHPGDSFGAWNVKFDYLMAFDIAAVWGHRSVAPGPAGHIEGCSGTVLGSRGGPGRWTWYVRNINTRLAKGASYISLPRNLPPGEAESNWLTAEGMLGLVWGGGRWFTSHMVSTQLDSLNLRKRDIRSAKKGQVYARSPPRVVFPSLVRMGDVNYTADAAEEMIYRNDVTGAIVNLTSEFYI